MAEAATHGLHALIEAAVDRLDDDDAPPGDPQSLPTGWWAIVRLHGMPRRETLDAAIVLCKSPDPTRRRVGAAVLGQLGHTKPGFRPVFEEERFAALDALLVAEIDGAGDVEVLKDVCIALGHLHDARAIGRVASLHTHPDAGVRYGVVHGLSAYEDERAIGSLIALSADPDDDVRDWATFGLGQLIETDMPAVRAALHARLDDADPDIRGEAIEGLARRKDRSILPSLIRELGERVSMPLFEAATTLADPKLCGALRAVKVESLTWTNVRGFPIDLRADWEAAMTACGCAPRPAETPSPADDPS